MSYHKKNLKEQLVEIAWEICKAESWKKVNMRKVAQKAGVSTTAFYRHFKNKDDQIISIYYQVESLETSKISTKQNRFDFKPGDEEIHRWVSLNELKKEDVTFPIDKLVVELLVD